jgi:hypothetical protein
MVEKQQSLKQQMGMVVRRAAERAVAIVLIVVGTNSLNVLVERAFFIAQGSFSWATTIVSLLAIVMMLGLKNKMRNPIVMMMRQQSMGQEQKVDRKYQQYGYEALHIALQK